VARSNVKETYATLPSYWTTGFDEKRNWDPVWLKISPSTFRYQSEALTVPDEVIMASTAEASCISGAPANPSPAQEVACSGEMNTMSKVFVKVLCSDCQAPYPTVSDSILHHRAPVWTSLIFSTEENPKHFTLKVLQESYQGCKLWFFAYNMLRTGVFEYSCMSHFPHLKKNAVLDYHASWPEYDSYGATNSIDYLTAHQQGHKPVSSVFIMVRLLQCPSYQRITKKPLNGQSNSLKCCCRNSAKKVS